jgi:hypothetical protein
VEVLKVVETSRLPHFLNNRLIDVTEDVSTTFQSLSTLVLSSVIISVDPRVPA